MIKEKLLYYGVPALIILIGSGIVFLIVWLLCRDEKDPYAGEFPENTFPCARCGSYRHSTEEKTCCKCQYMKGGFCRRIPNRFTPTTFDSMCSAWKEKNA
jgi:hypothetical protein